MSFAENRGRNTPGDVQADLRKKCLAGTRAYREAMIYAGHVRAGMTFEDLDRAIVGLVETKSKLDSLIADLSALEKAQRGILIRKAEQHDAKTVPFTPTEIIKKRYIAQVCQKYGVTWDDIKGPRRHKNLVKARHEFCWLMYENTQLSYPQIGRMIGDRDHTTIMNACNAHEKRMRAA